jgi:hypothetical protein
MLSCPKKRLIKPNYRDSIVKHCFTWGGATISEIAARKKAAQDKVKARP